MESAWHRLRELESHSWLRRKARHTALCSQFQFSQEAFSASVGRQQLDGALAGNDAVRLQANKPTNGSFQNTQSLGFKFLHQAAIKQAELGGTRTFFSLSERVAFVRPWPHRASCGQADRDIDLGCSRAITSPEMFRKAFGRIECASSCASGHASASSSHALSSLLSTGATLGAYKWAAT